MSTAGKRTEGPLELLAPEEQQPVQTIEFLETQLPVLKAHLDAADSALNAHRSRNGSVDVMLEKRLAQSALRPNAFVVDDVPPPSGPFRARYGYSYEYDCR